ncbi:uncharacterized protein Z520_00137 [Fonsecaea multimorphosa CBS 102226]|uniref:Xylanolytic transcriptional activator regulatory domain-containing protein n=1 Tax=Fonsecaea multimorphosa CBS 102226 TaxID=1442371 RepID=A0A0D2HNR4_9EURO|nr:uncharacterized protein Z520_00137 [Fonsecaea multimorphosa CBS 102226]KIY03446.1 hypothetical protein Z520_00137 [Fonsecaea multimorphosa CBS 102226]OAL32852.1 hypothetical protein AYO22_00178 [Fonsecaea multimorphosa]
MRLSLEEQDAKAARRRREKPQLSCNLYSSLPESTITKSPEQLPASNVRDRVKQLETQVDYLMGALKQAAPTPPALQDKVLSTPDQDHHREDYHQDPRLLADTNGWFQYSQGRDSYVGSAHWLAILRGIPALRDVFQTGSPIDDEDDPINEAAEEEPDLLGYSERINREDILKAIPSKDFVDTLIAVCFINTDNEAMIVHPQTFQKEYDRFWEDPTSASTMWIGLLFGLMCLAVQYQQFSPNEERRLQIAGSQPESLVRLYRQKTIQCLVLSKYFQGPRYAVETLLLYLFIEALRGDETKNLHGPWVVWGTLVRIAFRAGYHRDGSHFPSISCFEAERRRRVWTMLVGWDMYLSIQFGLPRMINPSLCDTADPRSLLEEDLDEDMLELPPQRPETSRTVPQFHVAKNQLLSIFGRINDLTMAADACPYSEVLRLDKVLTSAYESIIPVWRPTPRPQGPSSLSQSSATISVRCTFLSFIYHRAQIVLHRRYMSIGRNHQQYVYSYQVCIEAALTILQHQWALYLETRVGGQLCRHGWKFLSLLTQDFLFATAILCVELGEEIALADPSSPNYAQISIAGGDSGNYAGLGDRVFDTLSSSYIVWLQSNDSESSQEIKTVVAALRHLLGKAQETEFVQAKKKAPTPSTSLPIAGQGIDESGNTQSKQRLQGYGLEVEKPRSADVYWGLGHFPI